MGGKNCRVGEEAFSSKAVLEQMEALDSLLRRLLSKWLCWSPFSRSVVRLGGSIRRDWPESKTTAGRSEGMGTDLTGDLPRCSSLRCRCFHQYSYRQGVLAEPVASRCLWWYDIAECDWDASCQVRCASMEGERIVYIASQHGHCPANRLTSRLAQTCRTLTQTPNGRRQQGVCVTK